MRFASRFEGYRGEYSLDSSEKVSTDKAVPGELMEALVHVGQPVVVVNSSGSFGAQSACAEMFPVNDLVSLFEDSGRVESHLKRGFESALDAPLHLKNGRIVLLSVASAVHQGDQSTRSVFWM